MQEQQSQHEIPATEGQELENLSSIGRKAMSNDNDSIFDYEDDDAVDEPIEQWDALEYELRNYKNVKTKNHILICLILLKLTFTSQQHLSHLNVFSL